MNRAASIKSRLLNIAKAQQINYQLVLINFFQERLLYRISISPYANNFILKGGLLIYAHQNLITRPTKDADLLTTYDSLDAESMISVFKEICDLHNDDYVSYDTKNITATPIKENQLNPGLRVNITGSLDSIRQSINIDLAHGDQVIPEFQNMAFPVLLNDLDAPKIKVYSIESLLSEKIHAIFTLGTANSRMKDIFDVHGIINNKYYDPELFKQAMIATFRTRKTSLSIQPEFLEDAYQDDIRLLKLWDNFLRRNKLNTELTFKQTVKNIAEKLKPIWQEIENN